MLSTGSEGYEAYFICILAIFVAPSARRHIAKTIPQLANQLIVLVTKTQWRGEVEAEMTDRIGREYVLTYYSSKPNCEQDYIELGGESYPLVKQSPNEYEYTEIIAVERNV